MTLKMTKEETNIDNMLGAVAEQWSAALRVAGSILAQNQYLYGLHIEFRVWVYAHVELYVCKHTYDRGFIPRVGHFCDCNVTFRTNNIDNCYMQCVK